MGQRRGQRTIWRSTEGLGRTTQSVRRAGQEDPLHFFPSKRTVSGRYKAKTKKNSSLVHERLTENERNPPHFLLNAPWTFIGMFIATQKPPFKTQIPAIRRRPPSPTNDLEPQKRPYFSRMILLPSLYSNLASLFLKSKHKDLDLQIYPRITKPENKQTRRDSASLLPLCSSPESSLP